MNVGIPVISEINRQAESILVQQLGVANTLRFFNQYHPGSGNYTVERHEWLDNWSLDTIIQDIENNRR